MENTKLKDLRALIGEWDTEGTHPLLPGRTLLGRTSFEWLESGAFIIMHSTVPDPEIPNGVAIFGSDDSTDDGSVLYFDDRGVSREYRWTLVDNTWSWWRNAPGFSQRFVGTLTDSGRTIIGNWELSRDGSTLGSRSPTDVQAHPLRGFKVHWSSGPIEGNICRRRRYWSSPIVAAGRGHMRLISQTALARTSS